MVLNEYRVRSEREARLAAETRAAAAEARAEAAQRDAARLQASVAKLRAAVVASLGDKDIDPKLLDALLDE